MYELESHMSRSEQRHFRVLVHLRTKIDSATKINSELNLIS